MMSEPERTAFLYASHEVVRDVSDKDLEVLLESG